MHGDAWRHGEFSGILMESGDSVADTDELEGRRARDGVSFNAKLVGAKRGGWISCIIQSA